MNKDKFKNFTVIDGTREETKVSVELQQEEYQSNPIKTDLYSRLAAFRNSQRKFGIKDVIKDSLK
ncbi:MAG: hypothetical protein ACI4S3_10565 [Candidatus Gastranaerophilaceae bacterium]